MNLNDIQKRIFVRGSLLFLITEVLFCIYAFLHVKSEGYLPSPFFYVISDTFMDFYNSAYWSSNIGRYTVWGSVYPPLSFNLMNLVLPLDCKSLGSSVLMRECAEISLLYLFIFCLLGSFICAKIFIARQGLKNFPGYYVILLAIIFFLSLPSMYSLERGNLVAVSFCFLSLYVYINSRYVKSVFLGIAINLKPYLAILVLIDLFRRDYRSFFLNCFSALIIYLISALILNDDNHLFFLSNTLAFSSNEARSFFEKCYYSTSITPFLNDNVVGFALKHGRVSDVAQGFLTSLDLFFHIGLSFGVLLLMFLFIKVSKANSESTIGLGLLTSLAVMTGNVGGYFVLLLFPFIADTLTFNRLNILIVIILLTPWDIPLYPTSNLFTFSYFTSTVINYSYSLNLGSYVRPLAIILLFIRLLKDQLITFKESGNEHKVS